MKSSTKFIKKLLLIAVLLTGLPTKPAKINLNGYEKGAIFLSAGIFITGWYCIDKYFSIEDKKTLQTASFAPTTIQSVIDETARSTKQKFPKKLSPTQLHLMYVIAFKNVHPLNIMLKKHNIKSVVESAFQKEIEYTNKDYYTCYHSTRPKFYAAHYIDTAMLRLEEELYNNKHIPKTILNLRQPTKKKTHLNKKKAKTKRHFYLKKEIKNDHEHVQYLLSCNYALTGNLFFHGECTLKYFIEKRNIAYISIDTKTITEQYSFTKHIQKYTKKIRKSINKFNRSNNESILLQLIFKDKNLLNKTSYLSKAYGEKYNFFNKANDPQNTQTELLYSYIKKHNHVIQHKFQDIDHQQIRVILTHDKLLDVANPKIYNNFEVHAYSTNQQGLDEFHHEIDTDYGTNKS